MISNIGEGATPLMYACQQSREKEVLDLIARKRNSVRERDRTLKTPLHYCTENASIGCAEAVLRAAPELLDAKDEDGYTALHLAVIAGNKTFLRFLISRGANVNALDNERHSAVHWATVCGEEEALDIILRAGANISTADIHGGYPLHYAAQMCGPGGEMGRDPKIGLRILNILLSRDIDINVKDKDGRQPILWAASAGSADAILALVKAGASVEASDKDGLTALHCAASRGHTDCIETLVTLCGAHIDVIDSNGCTALFYAVTLGHADATQLLLSLGAEPNRQDRKGRTPAHCGAAKGQLETLRILLNYGANLWLRNVKGDFPLHEAVASGRRDLVRWLLNQRLDSINVGNNDGRCPIHIAAINNNIDMVKILLDAQSLVNPIMRTTKGVLMTPLDAALHRGFRGCAKYLQLHGGVPFTKLTEKSSNLKGISSRQVTSDLYIDNYADRVGASNWAPNSSTTLPTFIAAPIRMGGDNAIQQIETSELRAVTRIQEEYEDVRSSDEERISRRRRRRKKWEHQRKGYVSEEDSNLEDQPRGAEYPRRRLRTGVDDERHGLQKKREQLDGSSSDNDYYRRKAMRKKDSTSDSDEKVQRRRFDRRRYHSATEDSENERKRERKRKSRKENSHKAMTEPEQSKEEERLELEPQSTGRAEAANRSEGSAAQSTAMAEATNRSGGSTGQSTARAETANRSAGSRTPSTARAETANRSGGSGTQRSARAESGNNSAGPESQRTQRAVSANRKSSSGKRREVHQSTVVEVHQTPVDDTVEAQTISAGEGDSKEATQEAPEEEPIQTAPDDAAPAPVADTTEEAANDDPTAAEDDQTPHEPNEPLIEVYESVVAETHHQVQTEALVASGDMSAGNGAAKEAEEAVENPPEVEQTVEVNEPESVESKSEVAEEEAPPQMETVDDVQEQQDEPVVEAAEAEENEVDDGNTENFEDSVQREEVQELTEEISGEMEVEKQEENEDPISEMVANPEEEEYEEEEEEEGEEVIEEDAQHEDRDDYTENAFEILDNSPNSAVSARGPCSRSNSRKNLTEGNSSRRGSESYGREYRSGDAEGSIGDESGGSTRNEDQDSSALLDSGIEPSPRRKLRDSTDREVRSSGTTRTRVPRLCNRGKDPEEVHSVSVTQTVQNTIRKYHMERRIFYQLLELKRLQIRAGRANEQVLVKRLVDEYRRGGIVPGLKNYSGQFTFRQFEKFLYDQLRTLQSTAHILIPKLRPSDDIETLSTILRKSRVELVDDIPDNPIFCTQGTHRCHHAAHAYTGIPCAAYITKFNNHHEMPKTRSGFLPHIEQATYAERSSAQQSSSSYRPVTLEVSHGKEKQVISLPTDRLDKNKRYYVTFTIKGGPSLEESKPAESEERMLRHRHAKSF